MADLSAESLAGISPADVSGLADELSGAEGPEWTWAAASVEGEPFGELMEATGRSLSFDLRGPCTASFSIDNASPIAHPLHELLTDLFVWCERELIFRGRLGSADDDLDADQHTTKFAAIDYRGMVDAWFQGADQTFTNRRQDDIAWDLINQQQLFGNSFGITRGSTRAENVTRTEIIEADTPTAEAVDRFQDYADGFEWWIDPYLRFQVATWRGYPKPDFPIVWGVSATSIKRAYDTKRYGNWVRVRGGKPEGAATDAPEYYADRWASNLSQRREGRYMRLLSNQDLKTQKAVNDAADQFLADSLNPPAAYTATLAPGKWFGPFDLWLGDTVPIYIRSGRLRVETTGRVSQLDIGLTETDDTTVAVTFGHE